MAKEDKEKKQSEESSIIEFVLPTKVINANAGLPEGYDFFCDQYGTHSTTIEGIVVSIDSEEFHNKIASDYYLLNDKIFSQSSWDKAKRYFKIRAGTNPVRFSPLRCHASETGEIYYDTGKMIYCFDGVSRKTYLPHNCPIKFRRYKHTQFAPVKEPETKTYLEVMNEIMKYFNTTNFLPAILPTYFIDRHSQPILCFTGAAGSAKSTFETVVKRLVDPTSAERINIRDEKNDWVTMWDKFYILDFDNVRDIKAEEADMLSRAVTGGSIIRRTLYTNSDVSIHSGKLRILLNGIRPEPSQFNDLLDRMIIIEMDRISPDKRLSDEKLWEKISDIIPEVRYVCLDVAAKAFKNMWASNHPRLPRLGEFARLADAANVELHQGEDYPEAQPGYFINWYFGKITEASSVGVEDDFANVMLRYLNDAGQAWFIKEDHSAHDWISQVLFYCTEWDAQESRYHRFDLKRVSEDKNFPHNAIRFGQRLTEIIPVLADHGYHVKKLHKREGVAYKISFMPK